jgi:hypothetical protein
MSCKGSGQRPLLVIFTEDRTTPANPSYRRNVRFSRREADADRQLSSNAAEEVAEGGVCFGGAAPSGPTTGAFCLPVANATVRQMGTARIDQ